MISRRPPEPAVITLTYSDAEAVQFNVVRFSESMDKETEEDALLLEMQQASPNCINRNGRKKVISENNGGASISFHEVNCDNSKIRQRPANIPPQRRFFRKRPPSGSSISSTSAADRYYPTWSNSAEARATLIAVLSALYAVLLVILALAFEVSIVVVDSANAAKYDELACFVIWASAISLEPMILHHQLTTAPGYLCAIPAIGFYIYLYGAALVFFAYCYAFLLQSEGCNVTPPRWCRHKRRLESENDMSEGAATQIDQCVVMSLKRKATHSAKSAGSLYLRLGCVGHLAADIFIQKSLAQFIHILRTNSWNMCDVKRLNSSPTTSTVTVCSNHLEHGILHIETKIQKLIFGVIGLIDKGLRLFVAFDSGLSSNCFRASAVAETFLTGAFVFVQMFFIFQNSKLIIHRFKSIGCIGTMHVVATNLCMWIRSLVEEQYTVIQEIRESVTMIPNDEVDNVNVTHKIRHHIDSIQCHKMSHEGRRDELDSLITHITPFMTTCIIEYSLICSAVMYILWRNIGHVPAQRCRQRKQRFHVDCSSSTKGLFLGLLFMTFTIVAMIIFFTKIRAEQNYAALWIFYAWDSILYVVSIVAVVLGMFRVRKLYYVPRQKHVILLDDLLLIGGLIGQLMYCVFSVVPLNSGNLTAAMIAVTSLLRMIQVLLQTIFIVFGQRLSAMSSELQATNPGRETITFLLLINLSMFIINTFETHKASANPLTAVFYGENIWSVIVHSTVPLSIFYRFHSTVCLAEIWKEAYRLKPTESPLLT